MGTRFKMMSANTKALGRNFSITAKGISGNSRVGCRAIARKAICHTKATLIKP